MAIGNGVGHDHDRGSSEKSGDIHTKDEIPVLHLLSIRDVSSETKLP
jgi:hypothetical protein